MIIDLNKDELIKCLRMTLTKDLNIQAAEYYIDFLTNSPTSIKFAKDENDWFYQFNKLLKIELATLFNSKMMKITKLDPNDYLNDSYYKTIGQIKAKNNEWELTTLHYEPFEGFVSNEIEIGGEMYNEHTPISYFEQKFPFLAIIQDDIIWMSIMPHEINTMKQPIIDANGNVLVLGLGLGYYLFNVLKKDEVNTVTVVEYDEKVINLFKQYLLPKFPNKDKLKIVKGDGINFIKTSKEKYDFVFSDIWHNVGDGEMLYLKIKANEKYHPEAKFAYWIETSILAMLRRQILGVFYEEVHNEDESIYEHAENDNDLIMNKIHFLLKDYKIKTFNDLHDLVSEESLKVLATKLF